MSNQVRELKLDNEKRIKICLIKINDQAKKQKSDHRKQIFPGICPENPM